MGKYVYIDKDSTKGRFGIGQKVFEHLAQQAISRIPELVHEPVESRHRHRLQLNSSEIDIHLGVVYVKLSVNAKKSADIEELKRKLSEEINTSFMMVAEQVPVQIKIKVENTI